MQVHVRFSNDALYREVRTRRVIFDTGKNTHPGIAVKELECGSLYSTVQYSTRKELVGEGRWLRLKLWFDIGYIKGGRKEKRVRFTTLSKLTILALLLPFFLIPFRTLRLPSLSRTLSSRRMAAVAADVVKKIEGAYDILNKDEKGHSLLKKYLSKEVIEANKNKKTAMGASLWDCIQSGVANTESGVGIYAPDAESYTTFKDVFYPIINDYHIGFDISKGAKHPAADFGLSKLNFPNPDPEEKYIVSTRVRCGRSLQGYPFNPLLTEAQYKEMETKVKSALEGLTGELAGTYYPLTGMSKENQNQLIADHFLFKEGDRFLQTANANRFWPTGRGIYHNKDKTFLVWINEEDHLRIISMQKGGDLLTIFKRLIEGVNQIEKKLPFSHDDALGFLTFCPTNLGTTVRASVHIKLPNLSKNLDEFHKIAGKYNLQVRGSAGEHSEAVGGVYDVSNKRRMGLTEYDAVKEMYDGIVELIKLEKSMEGK